jgi:lipocalin-like protein
LRREILRCSALATIGLALLGGSAAGHERSLQEQLVGTWKIVSVNNTRPDGSIKQIFGPNPKGIAVFDDRGNTVIVLMRSGRPHFAANNRDLGTPEEFKATVQGTHAYFGTYSVIEAEKTLVFHVEGNTFPNQEGVDTKRFISINGDDFTWITPNPSVGGTSEAVWKRVR